MTRVLMTGGAGFIGSHLSRRLVDRDDEVHVIVRESTDISRLKDIRSRISIHVAELDDGAALKQIFQETRPEIVMHLAAMTRPRISGTVLNDTQCALTDISALLNVLDAAEAATSPPALFMRTGTLAEYGDGPYPYRESQREQPVTTYAAGMVAATHLCDVLQKELSFPVINARLALVYGAHQSNKFLVPQLLEACLNGGTAHVRYPEERRDLIHVDDVTSALLRLADKPPVNNRTINVATGTAPTMREVADLILRLTGAPENCVTFGAGTGAHGIGNFLGSPELMQSLYGWSAGIKLEDGLRNLIDQLRSPALHETVQLEVVN
jgi:nucleoside-diphosphate-sugar epimerase